MKLKEISQVLEAFAPTNLAEPWDNVGIQVGDLEQEVSTVFVCLDVTSENLRQAKEYGADLILSHHPLLFAPPKRIVEQEVTGRILRELIRSNISVYSAHTNLDHADGGMNDVLAKTLTLTNIRRFSDEECRDGLLKPIDNIGRVGVLASPMSLQDFASLVKEALGCRSLRYLGDPQKSIKTVALCSGAGGDGIYSAYHAGADAYVTSDIRHHEAQLAAELGLCLIDAGHFETENTICDFMAEFLKQQFPELSVVSSTATPYFEA